MAKIMERKMVPTPHVLKQIQAGTLKAFVEPLEPQPPKKTASVVRVAGFWIAIDEQGYHLTPMTDGGPYYSPHQPGDLLDVAEEWWEDIECDRLSDRHMIIHPRQTGKRGKWLQQPAETMPPGLANHHVEVTGVRPVQVTDLFAIRLHNNPIVNTEVALQLLESLGYGQLRWIWEGMADFERDWNTAHPALPFDKGPWAWLYQCKIQERSDG